MPDSPIPARPSPERPSATRLDPVALAWYRYRIAEGHYEAHEVLRALAEHLHQGPELEGDPPAR